MALRRPHPHKLAALSGISFAGLRGLESIYRTGSFQAAADELKISISSLSQTMGRLQQDLGIKLLYNDARNRNRLVCTAQGERIALVTAEYLPLLSRELFAIRDRSTQRTVKIT